MFEGFRRKDKRPEPEFDPSRRRFVLGAAAASVTLLAPELTASLADARESNDVAEKTETTERLISAAKRNLKSPDVLSALEGKGTDPFIRALRAIEAPILPANVERTKYDIAPEREKYAVQLAYRNVQGQQFYATEFNSKPSGRQFAKPPVYGYTNGFYFGKRLRFVTALHGYQVWRQMPITQPDRDIACLQLPTGFEARSDQVIEDDPNVTNADIHGSYVCVGGIDPDSSADSQGFKAYPGVAIQISEKLSNASYQIAQADKRNRAGSFMIVLPPGEARRDANDKTLADGMSGSPVFIYKNGKRSLAGILYEVQTIVDPINHRAIDVGYFHGIDDIRKSLKEEFVA